jgi:hypothetical protein
MYLIKTNPVGDTMWTRTYNGSGLAEGNAIQQTSDGGYIVSGTTYSSWSTQDSADVYLVKTDSNGLITDVSDNSPTGRPSNYALNQNYPNPFNPLTMISYQLPSVNLVVLKVFDILGREVTTLVNNIEQLGYKSITFDASKLSSGVYYYRLQTGNYVETKKLLLLR